MNQDIDHNAPNYDAHLAGLDARLVYRLRAIHRELKLVENVTQAHPEWMYLDGNYPWKRKTK